MIGPARVDRPMSQATSGARFALTRPLRASDRALRRLRVASIVRATASMLLARSDVPSAALLTGRAETAVRKAEMARSAIASEN
jgi:hypothetical protein